MQLLGIGPLELLLIAVIAIIVLGPKGMVNGAREAGKLIRKVIKSPIWTEIVDTSREIREFPQKLAREAGIEKDLEDLRKSTRGTLNRIQAPEISPIVNQQDEVTKEKSTQKNGEKQE
ncbi:MAG: twin-arginine translocase TatA/TatE family subunit [Pelolinea sp.]|nr:twin-arginine translocase TatA/TatE family subunit [Pelolinea sp.]